MQAKRHFGDHAERAFRADEKAREIVARRGLAGAATGADQSPVRQHDFERQHGVAHRAVSHRHRPRAARRGHAADGGVGAGIDGKEQAGVAQRRVQRLSPDAGTDPHVHVGRSDSDDRVHPARVEAKAALDRRGVAFEGGSGAEGDHGDAQFVAGAHDCLHLPGVVRPRDEIGGRGLAIGLAAAELAAHARGVGHAFAEHRT